MTAKKNDFSYLDNSKTSYFTKKKDIEKINRKMIID